MKRAEQYQDIYRDWRRGIDCTTLAERYDTTPRRVQQICDELRAASVEAYEVTSPLAGIKHVDRLLVQLDAAISDAAQILEGALADKNWAVAVGASRRVAEARRELLEMQQLRGIVPRNIATLEAQWDSMELVSRIFRVFDDFGLPLEVKVAVADLIEMETRTDRGRVELDMRTRVVELGDADAVA